MRKRTNKLLSLLIALTMVLGMLPAMSLTAFAAEPGITLAGSDDLGTGWSYTASSQTLTLSGYNGGYIQGSGLSTLNLVLAGNNTITVDDASAKGIALGNNQSLNISGSGSLTINATGGSNSIYGIECNQFTMTSGTVTINANSSRMVYGVNANGSLSVTGGTLTANITGTSDGRGLYCKTGKLTVGSDAEVAVKVTNNGSNIMYGIYNNAYTASVTDNGDIELAGTVTITRDSGSTGSGNVYGIANGGSNSNTDGVISITGGTVTVTNAYYGIIAFTKGHDTAFPDVFISGGTVNVTSITSGSSGIVSWNNGVTISGGTVTAGTASPALRLVDSDSANKTGLVKITDDAKVSLTSTGYKALVVQGDESTSSTRVHQINLTSGGSVTVKSTSSDESYYTFPVQGYFNLGSSTKITEGSLRSTADGINANGGRLFQADSTTKQVVVAYSTPYTEASAVSVNGCSFAPDKLYYKNGGLDTTNDSTDYNAYYNPATGILELNNYNSGPIIIGGANAYDVTVKLTGTNTVTTSAPKGGVGNVCVGISITNADHVTFIGDGTLTVNTNAGSGLTQVFGILLNRSATAAENLTFQSGKVTVNVTATDTDAQVFGISTVYLSTGGPITVAEGAELNVTLSSASTGLANGLYSNGDITLNGKTAITLTYTGSGSPSASNWSSVDGCFFEGNKLNVGANADITVDMPDAYSLTNGMVSAYYAAKSGSQIGNGDWTNTTASEQHFENDSFLVTQSVVSGYGYADYKYEVITPLTFEDKADYDIPAGTKDDSYTASTALTATGGSGEYKYEFEGTKPSDLSINAENKLVYTRSSLCGAATATVKVTDKGGISKSITIDIGAVTAASPGTGTVPNIENKTVTVGTDVFVPWPEGATEYQLFEGSSLVWSGDKSGYPTGMYIPAQSTAATKTYKFKVMFSGGWVESNEFTVTWTAAKTYSVTVQNNGNGSGSATPTTAAAGTEITLSATANSGYHFKEWQVISGSVTITDNKFTMPASDVTVKAIFEADAGGVTKLDKPTNLVWDGTTAKWDAVTGADKYRVILYANEDSGSGGFSLISNTDITTNSKDFSEYMLPGMYYYFEVAAYNSANYSETFSGFAYCDRKQMPGSIGTITGFAWSGNTISWTAVTGATGYDVWVMKDGTQKGSVRNISAASFDLTSDIASYGDGTYYVSVSAYKLARGNYLAEGNSPAKIIGTTPVYSATIRNVSVNGTIGTAITETQVVIDLTNDTFVSALSGNWITNLPAGLSQSVSRGGTTMAIITISGTPTAASTEQIAITIPADQLIVNTDGLAVTANANAKFNISAPTYSVTINAGANMALSSGNANQSGLSGAMTDTVYTAADGYYFPTDYAVAAVNGINVTRNSYTQITVSGTPTANTTITLAPATAKTLSSIAVTTAPAKVTYTAGEYFNTSGMVVTATYSDGSTEAVTSYTFTPTGALTTDDTSITISYTEGGVTKTATQPITVNAATKTLSSIAVTTAPAKVTYTAGENFDPTGMVVTATYSDGSTEAVTGYTFTPTGALTTDDTSITISYTEGGVTKTATQTITVNAATKTLSSIAVTTAPAKVTYTAGENFDPAGMVVTATYSDGSSNTVTGYTVTDGTALTAGQTSVTISYTEGGVTKTTTQAITVNEAPKTLSSIAVTTAPAKVTYTAGEDFDSTGMVVTATYSDGSTEAVTGYTFTPTGALTTGDTSITISYTEGGVTETTTQAITVNAAPKTLSSIAVTTAPAKVTYTAGENFNPAGMVVTATYSDGSTEAVTGYTFTPTGALTTDDTSITISYTEGGVTKTTTQAITVNASSAPATHTVTVNGSYAADSGAGSYDEGDTVYIYAGNRSGYTFDGWTSSDVTITDADSKTASFVMPDYNVTVTAHWTRNAVPVTPTEPSTYTIKVEKTDNGDVTVSPKSASKGTTVTITVEPDKGYTLETLTVTDKNGDEIRVKEKNGKYTFTMPASKVYVEATFMEDNAMLNFFVDVPASAYYYDAVMWAAKNGITGGTDATHFSPNATCTRAQAVTFLWRAAGSPAPKSSTMPFTDVKTGSYYETAVLWAVENGITNGTGDTTFSPNATCSRGQIVSFLWRALGSRAVSGSAVFTDVKTGSYYETAVLWAVENGITNGTGNNAFSPNADCTRAQIVSFLYRTLVK